MAMPEFPEGDKHFTLIAALALSDLPHYYEFCEGFEVAVQAGANVGMWPDVMADRFERVYAFEPDPGNFAYFVRNCLKPNVYKYQAALGAEHGGVSLERVPNNCGATFVKGKGTIPTLKIDDLALDACDFIMLDVEGYELNALLGAKDTIERYKPVIVTEAKDLFARYGQSVKDLVAFMGSVGYKDEFYCHRDIVWTRR